ncbi:MAG: protein phosphatase 2C domain-containing protein [Pseudomonadota bacterium]|nr:protein phosphatase 2C domain-containing protein [Pseudomonadota bacterium]MDP1905929.1 protein phosphatase 2C domain-containing protein [Pseudomonadota bacterium]MDP2353607.1 protein phosphatase 2C domain-containing protein [Pseudomonadota bacterium]
MKYVVYQASRCGGRPYNEDRVGYAYTSDALLMVLADGMGGHARGEIASQLTVQVITGLFNARAKPLLADMASFLLDGIYAAHDAINEYAMRHKLSEPPRTTCVVCVVQKGHACWAHVGDSRLYHFNRRALKFRTHDHSAVQQLVDDGLLDEDQMGVHPDRNKLYNSVGGYMLPDIELENPVKLNEGDVLYSCTDGVWSELNPQEMLSTLRAYPLERAVKNMLDHAEFRAGQYADNLSAVAMRFGEEKFDDEELVQADDLGLDGFTTQLKRLGNKEMEELAGSDYELERALAEIQTVLGRRDPIS